MARGFERIKLNKRTFCFSITPETDDFITKISYGQLKTRSEVVEEAIQCYIRHDKRAFRALKEQIKNGEE